MKLFIITEEELEKGNDAVHECNFEYGGFKEDLETKPLTLCRDCKKWKTGKCLRLTLDAYGFKKRQSMDSLDTWTDPDDFCKDGEAK